MRINSNCYGHTTTFTTDTYASVNLFYITRGDDWVETLSSFMVIFPLTAIFPFSDPSFTYVEFPDCTQHRSLSPAPNHASTTDPSKHSSHILIELATSWCLQLSSSHLEGATPQPVLLYLVSYNRLSQTHQTHSSPSLSIGFTMLHLRPWACPPRCLSLTTHSQSIIVSSRLKT